MCVFPFSPFHLKSVGSRAANLDLRLNLSQTANLTRLRTTAASRHGAWEQSENVRSIFISILPPHLAPVTWLSVSGSCGVQRGLINGCPRCASHHPAHRARLTWRLSLGLSPGWKLEWIIFLKGLMAPLGVLSSEAFSVDDVAHVGLLPVSVGCGANGTAGSQACPPPCLWHAALASGPLPADSEFSPGRFGWGLGGGLSLEPGILKTTFIGDCF